MLTYLNKKKKPKTAAAVIERKKAQLSLSMVTCYDATFASLINMTDIDIVLVGDSLGNVILGHQDTTRVVLSDIIRHSQAVSSTLQNALLCADMPFLSYQISCQQALSNAGKLIQEGHAHAVKLEGGRAIAPQVKALTEAGIPVMGHLGLTPQHIHSLGGYKVQGRDEKTRKKLIEDAKILVEAGIFALVLELIPEDLAKEITSLLPIPSIGIGAGPFCDGQVLVLHDLLGLNPNFTPKFVKKYANLADTVKKALSCFDEDVKSKAFPQKEHTFS